MCVSKNYFEKEVSKFAWIFEIIIGSVLVTFFEKMDAQRELLDQLMGKNRNLSKDDAPLREQHWNDADICPYYLCAFCPNDLFINTKSDLGACEYEHVFELKKEYQQQPRKVKRRIEKKLLYYLYDLIKDVDRKIRRGKDRISLNAPSTDKNHSLTNVHNQLMYNNTIKKKDTKNNNNNDINNNNNDINIDDDNDHEMINNIKNNDNNNIEIINNNNNKNGIKKSENDKQLQQKKKDIELRCEQLDFEINKLNDHIDKLCNDNKIDDAEVLLKQVETLEKEKQHLKNMDLQKLNTINHDILNNLNGIKNKDKNRFEICEVCGVFQAIDDAEDRIARHFDGKQHKGYDIIRKKIKELEALHKKEEQQYLIDKQNRKSTSRSMDHYYRDRERNRHRYESRGVRDRDRDRNRDRNRNRDRERDKYGSKYNSRDKYRDNDKKRKDKYRDRDRYNDNGRSRDSNKRRRSRSRDKDRNRKRDNKRENKKKKINSKSGSLSN